MARCSAVPSSLVLNGAQSMNSAGIPARRARSRMYASGTSDSTQTICAFSRRAPIASSSDCMLLPLPEPSTASVNIYTSRGLLARRLEHHKRLLISTY